jgi:hypothetical protein
MHCVIPHFIGRFLRLEIKGPKTAVAASGSVKLRVQIEHAFGFQIDGAQIRISILSTATPIPIAASRGPALPIVSTMRSAPGSGTLASIAARVSFRSAMLFASLVLVAPSKSSVYPAGLIYLLARITLPRSVENNGK